MMRLNGQTFKMLYIHEYELPRDLHDDPFRNESIHRYLLTSYQLNGVFVPALKWAPPKSEAARVVFLDLCRLPISPLPSTAPEAGKAES